MKNFLAVLTFAVSLLSFTRVAVALEKLDLQTQSALIEKLESLVKITPDETESKQNLLLRLADLHSERARLLAMDDEGRGEETHRKEIEADRQRAITLYDSTFKKADKDKKGAILLQTAHLNQMLGNQKKSKAQFDQIIRDQKKYDPQLVAQAYIEVGDYEMNHQNFEKARKNFENAAKIPSSPRKGYTQYRIAWCDYHVGKTQKAINELIAILKNQDLNRKADGTIDTSFKEETSRDSNVYVS